MKKCKKLMTLLGCMSMVVSLSGCGLFETFEGITGGKPTSFLKAADLESGKAYVWHHDGGDIREDIKKESESNIYFTCITGDYNFKKKELEEVTEYPRSIWIDSDTDSAIPTVTSKDKLLYVSEDTVPESIVFERFADYGYTIGVSNLEADRGGHYYLMFNDVEEDDYKYYIDMKSDAAALTELTVTRNLYLDKVGNRPVTKKNVSDGGTVTGLTKDKTYTCEFYTGTYYQDFNLKANIHSFGSLERFVSYEYAFMHSNFIVIEIPDYFVSGYYFVNGVGLFRYVADKDAGRYNGKAYDENINWNEPMILYNEDGTVKYDPSNSESSDDLSKTSDPGDNGEVNVDVAVPVDEKETGENAESVKDKASEEVKTSNKEGKERGS